MPEIGTVTDDALRLTDFIILVDHSGSMETGSTRLSGKNRLQEVEEDTVRLSRQADKYDDDGLTVVHFASRISVTDGVTADSVASVFREYQPGGSTNTDGALQAAVTKVRASAKPNCVVVIFTDGGANDQNAVTNTLRSAAKEFGRPKVGFIFVRVGDDQGAKAFMDHLDSGLGDDVPDIVATVTAEEAEEMSIANLAWLSQNA